MTDSPSSSPPPTPPHPPSNPLDRPPRSILVVMLSALGDAVQVLPVLTALRRAFPATHLTWVLEPGPHELMAGHPAVDEWVVFQPAGGTPATKRVLTTGRAVMATSAVLRQSAGRLPGERYDLLLDLQVYLKAGLLTWLAPARIKLGFDRRRARDLNWLFTNHRIPRHPYQHTQDQYFEFLTCLGVDPEPVEYGFQHTPAEMDEQATFFGKLPGPACGIVLATSRVDKDWHAGGYATVIREVRDRWQLTPVFMGGTSQREEEMARAVQARVNRPIMDARGGGLRRLSWLLGGSRVVVSPDTGPLHLAHAMGTPVVGLYGSTPPGRYGPYRGDPRVVVDGFARYPGEPEPLKRDRRPGRMGRIGPEEVMGALEAALEGEGRKWKSPL